MAITLTHVSALNGKARASLVDWGSKRTKRQVRSTLAAEAAAADNAVDHGAYTSHFLTELLGGDQATAKEKLRPAIQTICVTDCKSLFDCIHTITPSLTEKRTLIDIYSIRQSLSTETDGSFGFRWVPTFLQFADGLTKIGLDVKKAITKWMQEPYVQLRE